MQVKPKNAPITKTPALFYPKDSKGIKVKRSKTAPDFSSVKPTASISPLPSPRFRLQSLAKQFGEAKEEEGWRRMNPRTSPPPKKKVHSEVTKRRLQARATNYAQARDTAHTCQTGCVATLSSTAKLFVLRWTPKPRALTLSPLLDKNDTQQPIRCSRVCLPSCHTSLVCSQSVVH